MPPDTPPPPSDEDRATDLVRSHASLSHWEHEGDTTADIARIAIRRALHAEFEATRWYDLCQAALQQQRLCEGEVDRLQARVREMKEEKERDAMDAWGDNLDNGL